ncbi:hypothetical protein MHY1_00581 [Methylovirgula sp. HY1]|nr:hypothetical protein MHY1_00581 [Methylovirgula sp. HY1]
MEMMQNDSQHDGDPTTKTHRSPWRWLLIPISPTRVVAEVLIDKKRLVC